MIWRGTFLCISIALSVTQHTWTTGFMFGVAICSFTYDVIRKVMA